ncbi:xin actin-binding repeat-containing protein 1-like [Saccostrea cucullata]|uniref:xin actin-binding repeat-containing protein 1-like n=1 Tax=Saccostrea cuccullata TaxID=36930 RepID=UPI002ED2ABD7
MRVQWHFLFILLAAVCINCAPNNISDQKSEATRAIQDAKAKISKSSAKFGKPSFKSYLPPAQPVSMKEIGTHLKSSKPKTFAFSSNSFRFKAPVFSQANLQLKTKQAQKLPRKEVFAKQDIQQYKPHTNKIIKKVMIRNKKQGPVKTIIKKIIIRRKIKVNKNLMNVNKNNRGIGGSNNGWKISHYPGKEWNKANIVENHKLHGKFRTQSNMDFSLQSTHEKVKDIAKDESRSETHKKQTTTPRQNTTPTVADKIKNTQSMSTGGEVKAKKHESKVDKTWVKNITRLDAVQRPIMKEPTPNKPQFANLGLKPAPMSVSSSYKIPFHKSAIVSKKNEQNLSTQQEATRNMIINSRNEASQKSSYKIPFQHSQAIVVSKEKEQNLSTQRETTRNMIINIGKDASQKSDIKSEAKINIGANTITSVTKNSDLTKLDEKKKVNKPPMVADQLITDFQIPLPPGEIFENGSLFMNLPRKEFHNPAEIVVNSITNDRKFPVETPPEKHKSLFDKFQSVQRKRGIAKSDIIPPDLHQAITVIQQQTKNIEKKPLEPHPIAKNTGLSSGAIHNMREPSQPTGVSVGVSLSEHFNQHPPPPGHFRPGFIPPPPPSGFRRHHIPNPPAPWNVPTPPLITPANRIHTQTNHFGSNQNTLNHRAQMNYIQTKVPLSGVIPQPPIVARKHSRFSRPKNIAPYPQPPPAYLTKAPNKLNQVPVGAQDHGPFEPMHVNYPRNRHNGGPQFNRDSMRKPPTPPTQNFVDTTVIPVVNKPEPRPRKRNLPKPVKFDPLKHIMKRKQELAAKKAKKPTNVRKPPEPPGEKTASPDPDRKKLNQKIFKNSFQKDYVNERRSNQPMKEFVSEFERFMKQMDSFMDLAGMLEF